MQSKAASRSVRSTLSAIVKELYECSMTYLLLLALCVDIISPYGYLDVEARRSIMMLSNDEESARKV